MLLLLHKPGPELRIAELRITDADGKHETTIFNVHNHELSPNDRAIFKAAWDDAQARVAANPSTHNLILIGGFNISELPPKSLLRPVDATTTDRYQYQPVYWKRIFSSMIEVTTRSTTHRSAANMTEATIDRCFIPTAAFNIPHLETHLTVDSRPLERVGEPASDHKVLHLRLRPRAQRPRSRHGGGLG